MEYSGFPGQPVSFYGFGAYVWDLSLWFWDEVIQAEPLESGYMGSAETLVVPPLYLSFRGFGTELITVPPLLGEGLALSGRVIPSSCHKSELELQMQLLLSLWGEMVKELCWGSRRMRPAVGIGAPVLLDESFI